MKYSKKCDCCGHMSTAYTFAVNVGNISSLRKLVDKYQKTKEPVHLKSLEISNSQYTNFCHLEYFGLIRHVGKGWVPTKNGIMFIYGNHSVVSPQAVMNGVVLYDDHEAWKTHTAPRETVTVKDIHELSYKQHDEYAEEIDIPVSL